MGKYYFISDAHLGARYIKDASAHERIVCDALNAMAKDADAIFLMGDMLDFWFEWQNVVPKGYIRFFGTLASIADKGIKIYWFRGNHDMWLFGYLRDQLKLEVVDNNLEITLDDKNFVLSHGDNLGPMKPSYRFLRALFRNSMAQRMLAILHPRITLPFAHAWSAHSRGHDCPVPYGGDDKEPAMIFARKWQATHPDTDYYICGHRHIACEQSVGDSKAKLIILGDFYRQYTYAVFDGESVKMVYFQPKTH